MRALLFLPLLGLVACGHPFKRIHPGMTVAEVREVTGDHAPTDVRTWPQAPGQEAWYYGPDRCILVVNDVVRQKSVTRTRASGGIPGVVRVSVRDQAECAPPGLEANAGPSTNVSVPGFGGATVR
ncbi:MAG: hypothetical protein IAE78_28775 [Myxococcus sp.]|nr:hypothetical protein [Myxococcus sp.]